MAKNPDNATQPTVPCPQCGKPVTWSQESAFRPFCSERCKLIDLGAWASESHRIPGDNVATENDED